MAQTFCGKTCTDCVHKEALNCPGCRVGPGRSIHGECDMAQCCRSRGHETCETCNIHVRCGKYIRREQAPLDRLKRMNAEQERIAETARATPQIARWMRILLWLVIPSEIGGLLTNQTISNLLPGFYIPGMILMFGSSIAYCAVLFVISKLEERYRKAGIFMLIGIVISAVANLAGDMQAVALLFGIPAIVISLMSAYQELHAHSDVMADVDRHISESWLTLWKFHLIVYGLLYGSVILMILSVLLGIVALIGGALGTLIVGVVKLILLNQSSKHAKIFTVMAQE